MKLISFFVLFISLTSTLLADEWLEPAIKKYYSQNSQYMLKVIPTQFPKKYNDWRNARPKNKAKFSPSDTTIIPCHAKYFKIIKSDTIELWDKKLINKVMPVYVLVADDGNSFVTFDNWSSLGYGPDVMVIYNGNGDLIIKYQLEDFSPFRMNEYMHSVSSIWWRCGSRYIDNQTIEICFESEGKNILKKEYNLTTREFN